MSYRIRSIELYLRETPPGRLAFALGKKRPGAGPADRLTSPLAHVRLVLGGTGRGEMWGCSGDRLSVRWLDKRPKRSKGEKLRGLVGLIYRARDVYLERREFESPFALWRDAHAAIMGAGRSQGEEDLTSSFASALLERAMLDAVCRLEGASLFRMVREDRLGFRPREIHPGLKSPRYTDHLPARPLTRFAIRHTVGLADPLDEADLKDRPRVNDGLPETLEEYIRVDGVHYFKLKCSGEVKADMERLGRIWDLLPKRPETGVTLDANEAYGDPDALAELVRLLERDLTGLFQHILYIEQPLSRRLTLDESSAPSIRKIAATKPLVIDEADGTLDAFRRAHRLGYAGASHKNCKGFFKSLCNHALAVDFQAEGRNAFLSGEDLQNLPIVPLHQDFVSLSILGLHHCERNGHHYNYGLSMLSSADKEGVARHHRDLYRRRGDEWFLNVRDGHVDCASLQCPGYGVRAEPDWKSMNDLNEWLRKRYPG